MPSWTTLRRVDGVCLVGCLVGLLFAREVIDMKVQPEIEEYEEDREDNFASCHFFELEKLLSRHQHQPH